MAGVHQVGLIQRWIFLIKSQDRKLVMKKKPRLLEALQIKELLTCAKRHHVLRTKYKPAEKHVVQIKPASDFLRGQEKYLLNVLLIL